MSSGSEGPSIRFEDVTLRLRTYRERRPSLKQTFVGLFRSSPTPKEERELYANLDLGFQPGERVGLIGANGAGKTTLLKMACGIYRPTQGVVRVRGHVSALIEMGSGLNMELSGEDNVYLLGALHGRPRSEIKERIEPILRFAELGADRHMPIKYYSHGMRLRLAFATATDFRPEILLVDEIFAGGDLSFLKRAREKMRLLIEESELLVMVSHNLGLISDLCTRCVWLDRGRVQADGPTEEVLPAYKSWHQSRSSGS